MVKLPKSGRASAVSSTASALVTAKGVPSHEGHYTFDEAVIFSPIPITLPRFAENGEPWWQSAEGDA